MGRLNHENNVAIPGYGKPVLLSGDDSFVSNPAQSQVYAYIAADADAVWNDTGDLWAFVAERRSRPSTTTTTSPVELDDEHQRPLHPGAEGDRDRQEPRRHAT